MKIKRGLFITFEGPEGSGKSTQLELLASALEAAGSSVLRLREPGGTNLGEILRELIKHPAETVKICDTAEILLFEASRAQIVRERILPALESGITVLCDRYADSTTVYQGLARKIDAQSVAFLNHFATNGLTPDLTVLIDISVESGLARANERDSNTPDRLEQESRAFHESVRQGFLQLAQQSPERFLVL
ncbi:MAG: dTMP kinase, partial [Verrucomicrobia bacterium 21-51-4]